MTRFRGNSVYFIQVGNEGPIKIGFSTDPNERMAALQSANPYKLRLLLVISGTKEVERKIQVKFEEYCKRGEWFFPVKSLLDFIEQGEEQEEEKTYWPEIYCINCGEQFSRWPDDPRVSCKTCDEVRGAARE